MRPTIRSAALAVVCSLALAPLLAISAPAASAAAAPASAAIAQATAAAPAGIRSDTGSFTVASFDAIYDLGRDADRQSTLATTETIVADFPQFDQNHGIVRALPRVDRGTDLQLHLTAVTDESGTPLHYTTSTQDDFLMVQIGDADRYVHGRQTYVIRYTSRSVVGHFADTRDAEFYWDVNGTGWQQPFTRVTATVNLRDGIAADLTGALACYAGTQGGTGTCAIIRSGDTVRAIAQSLQPTATMTIVIGFHDAAFAPRQLIADGWFFAVVPWILLVLLLAGAAGVLVLRLGPWRDARGRGIIVAEYAPAADMYPALAAELLRRRGGWLAAEIVRFAVSGIVRIREHPTDPPAKRYELILVDPDAAPLQPDERALLSALFGSTDDLTPGASVRLDTTDRPLGLRIVARKGDAAAIVASRGLRERPPRRLSRWLSLGLGVLAIASIAHLIISAANSGATGWTVLVDGVVILASIVFFVLSFAPLRLTDAGAEQRDRLKGLRMYLELAEADRIRALQAPSTAERVDVTDRTAIIKLYEKLLPYAMVWGIEKQWIHELEQAYGTDAVPDWYFGNTSLIGLGAFSAAVSTASSSFGSSLATSSSSSSFGGSGSGGFSGGGGGGGGGGGW